MIAASDADAGQTLTFAVLGGSGAGVFNVDSVTGEISVLDSTALNFETVQSFDLLIEVTDSGSPGLSAQATITFELINLDDEPTGVALNGGAVSEAADTSVEPVFVGQLIALGGPANMFALVTGEGDTHNSLFQIDGDSLSLVQGAVLNHETQASLSIRVSASNGMVSAESVLTVNVTDANEPPTDITLSNDTVLDSADTGNDPVVVGELTVIDPDSPGAFGEYTFTLEDDEGGADNGAFQITGNLLEFKPEVMLDPSAQESYSVSVRADDGEHSIVQTFTVHVLPSNQAPFASPDTRFTMVSQAVTVVVLDNDGDDDGILDPASVTIVAPPANGTAVVNADGTITYTPDAEFMGEDTFQYTVADDLGAVSNAALVTIDVRATPPWQNPDEHMDINDDGVITIVDLLALVDFLREHGVGHALDDIPNPGDPMVDIDGNGMAELSDLLLLVQFLREQQINGEPEGESKSQIAAPANDSSLLFALDDEDDPWFVEEIAADRALA
jgi:hypothetical protein